MKDLLDKMKNLNENKNAKVVTFDFDNTIVKSFENKNDGLTVEYEFGGVNPEIIKRIKKFKKQGMTVLVVTARNVALENPDTSVQAILNKLNIEVDGIFYTNGDRKAQKLYELGSSLHYDDDHKEFEAIQAFQHLHSDFNIKVVEADSLLSDIDEVAKGLIMTTDGKIVIVQRSDSYEWDAAGGHLLDGELPEFAFWREVKEELQLDVANIKYLDSLNTTWKKKNKLVHYYTSLVPYSSEELKGAIQLQWELADYFCGDIREIEQQLGSVDGATQNLKNAVDLILQSTQPIFESIDYQALMRSKTPEYNKDKEDLLNKGPQKKGWGTGIKDLKLGRGKSAPPGAPGGGWGPMEEENEKTKKPRIKIKFLYGLDEKRRKKRKKKRKKRRSSKTKGMGSWGTWPYGSGGYASSFTDGDGGGDGGGGE